METNKEMVEGKNFEMEIKKNKEGLEKYTVCGGLSCSKLLTGKYE